MQGEEQETAAAYRVALILAAATLAFWSFGHRLYGSLLPGLADALSLSSADTGIARAAVVIGYFFMALPAAFISRNFGYKLGVLAGLGILAVGMFLFHPAVEHKSVAYIVMAAIVIGSGLALIEFTTAPLLIVLGPLKSAIQRVNFAHLVSALGTVTGVLLGDHILQQAMGKTGSVLSQSLMLPMASVGVAAIALAFFFELANFPAVASARVASDDSTWASFGPPLRLPRFRLGVAAQFLALLSEVTVAGYAIRYDLTALPSLTPQIMHAWFVWGMAAFVAGRFVGSVLMFRIEPMLLLILFSLGCMLCSAVSVFAPGLAGIYGVVGASFFLSIQFPTIFAHTIRDLGEMAKSGTAITMFVAFSGTGLVGLAVYLLTMHATYLTMVVPCLGNAGIAVCALSMRRAELAEHQTAAAAAERQPLPV